MVEVCPKGYIKRKSYTRKNTGKRVKSACVHGHAAVTKKVKKYCPPGTTARAGYLRKISANVLQQGYTRKTKNGGEIVIHPTKKQKYIAPVCVKKSVKQQQQLQLQLQQPMQQQTRIGPLHKGDLTKHGYSYKLPDNDRYLALQRAIQEYGPVSTYHKLNAVAKLAVTKAPAASNVFAKDRNWIRNLYRNKQI